MPSSANLALNDRGLAASFGPKQPKQPRWNDGHNAPHPAWVTEPRHGGPTATSPHGMPLALHSTQTL